MLGLIRNEFIKLFKRPKTIILIVLLFVVAIGATIFAYNAGKIEENYRNPDFMIKEIGGRLVELEDVLKRKKESPSNEFNEYDQIKELEDGIGGVKAELEYWKKEKINPTPWQKIAREDIEVAKRRIIETRDSIKATEEIKSLRKNEKEGLLRNLRMDIEREEEKIVLLKDSLEKDIRMTGWREFEPGRLMINFSLILSLAIPLFIAIFASDIVSDEMTNETLKFLLIQPVSRGKVLFAKFITLLITMLVVIVGTQMIIYLGAGLINGFEKLDLLVKVGIEYQYDKINFVENGLKQAETIAGSGYYITMGELMKQGFLMQVLFIISTTALVFFISTICKSNMISMAISTVLLVGGSIAPVYINSLGKFAHLTILGYSNQLRVIQGELGYQFNNIHYSQELGMSLMIITTIILLILANTAFSKRDILV
ncbi:MAG: ABC transporter permease subunit [Clostridium sp.]